VKVLREIRSQYPDEFAPLDYRLALDSSGEPGVWVWGKVGDQQNVAEKDFRGRIERFDRNLSRSLNRGGVRSWPYLGIRTPHEQHMQLRLKGM
jgi:hypothetical protein